MSVWAIIGLVLGLSAVIVVVVLAVRGYFNPKVSSPILLGPGGTQQYY